jgi:hypothetical protein
VGSVTEKVSRRASIPVLTMHRPADELPQPRWAEEKKTDLDEVAT